MAYKKKSRKAASDKYVYIKKRISKAQGQAKCIGLLYLLGIIGIAALACLPLITVESVGLGVMEFWKPFTLLESGIFPNLIPLLIAVTYGVMLLVLLINIIRGFSKLGWLFKKKASKLYGFNRNAYAMDDLGKIFSSTFSAVVGAHFIITLVAGGMQIEGYYGYILLGVGILLHFVCGLFSGNVSLFSTDDGIYEEKRELGNFSPFVRNLLQLVATAAAMWMFVAGNTLKADVLDVVVAAGGFETLFADFMVLISPIVQLVLAVVILCMLGYATGTTEFDMEGPEAAGRKLFLLWSFLALAVAGAFFALVKASVITTTATEEQLLQFVIIAGVALVMVIAELCLMKCPKGETQNLDDVDSGMYLEQCNKPGVYMYNEQDNAAYNQMK